MNVSIKSESPISRVRYVNNNSILTDNEQNRVFKKFIDFVERMLLFYSLDSRGYEGFTNGNEGVAEGIVNSGKVQDFQRFLKENDHSLRGLKSLDIYQALRGLLDWGMQQCRHRRHPRGHYSGIYDDLGHFCKAPCTPFHESEVRDALQKCPRSS